VIRFARHRLRTNKKGRTTIVYRFRRRGRYNITVNKAGYQRASATITVRP
jgi:hypothetical protein